MNKDKALESVNEIKELMEKSSKFISFSGLAAIMAGIYALVGAYVATQSYYTRHKVEHSFGTNDHSSFTCIDSLRCHCLYPFLL